MRVITCVFMILGCFMGAGFVSGREVSAYFARFGESSIYSIVFVTILLFILILFFLLLSKKTNSFDKFAKLYFGRFHVLADWLLAFCVLILVSSMFAGTITLAKALKLNQYIIITLTLILCFFVMQRNIKILSRLNLILVPFLIFILLIVSLKNGDSIVENLNFSFSFFSGGVYVFINIVTLGLFILQIGEKYTIKQKIVIALISSLIIGLLLFLSSRAIMSNGIIDEEMPNLVLASSNKILYISMQICIYYGLFSTLCSNVFLLSNFINKYINNFSISLLLTLSLGVGMSSLGFVSLVGYVYWIVGVIGLIMIIMVICKGKRIDHKVYP